MLNSGMKLSDRFRVKKMFVGYVYLWYLVFVFILIFCCYVDKVDIVIFDLNSCFVCFNY